jgi:hypothetical protein
MMKESAKLDLQIPPKRQATGILDDQFEADPKVVIAKGRLAGECARVVAQHRQHRGDVRLRISHGS